MSKQKCKISILFKTWLNKVPAFFRNVKNAGQQLVSFFKNHDYKYLPDLLVAIVATVIGGFVVVYGGKLIDDVFADKTPYITFSSDGTQVFKISNKVETLEYSVGDSNWEELGTDNITFGGAKGDLRLRGKSKVGTPSAQISFATKAEVICTGDIRTLIDWENYVSAETGEAVFMGLFASCTPLVTAPDLKIDKLADCCYWGMFAGCTSLVSAPELPATELAKSCYWGMFNGCKSLINAPELPATKLAEDCYWGMFASCKSLINAPELPATELADDCYSVMFNGCASLEKAPELPATELAKSCYDDMFLGCTSLTSAPDLPATQLAPGCYKYMFSRCTSLENAPKLFAIKLEYVCYEGMFSMCTSLKSITMLAQYIDIHQAGCYNWLVDVSPTGTFYKNENANWSNDATCVDWNGENPTPIIPPGWTVVEVDSDEEKNEF